MPKSKRDKIIPLTQVKKRIGREWKQEHVSILRDLIYKYKYIYVYSVDNMRNSMLKALREKFRSSRFYFGKNSLISRAFGDKESEVMPELHKISERMLGESGLFFTDEPHEDIIEFFEKFKQNSYARAGFIPIETIERHPGPIDMSHEMEPVLRKLGMTTSLKNGIIILEKEYTLCTAGQPLTPENARLLKLFGMELAVFQIKLNAVWHDGEFEELES